MAHKKSYHHPFRYIDPDFIVEFSPDGMFAVVARREGNTVVGLNLKSSIPQLTIGAGMEVYGLGVIRNTVVAIGRRKVIGWKLPAGYCVPNGLVDVEDRSWTINLCGSQDYSRSWVRASISPDSRYIALTENKTLHIHRTSTGEHLGKRFIGLWTPRFSLDGRKVWCTFCGSGEIVLRVGGGREVLEHLSDYPTYLSRENPQRSYHGYRVADDWWILGPDEKRLFMLPPPWRSYAMHQLWKGSFLALLHGGPSEAVILEFDVNRDL